MEFEPQLPVPISLVNNKFLIFDIDTVTYLRRVHHICGVMTGTLPQNPSQNIFLGLPMQIMPEEAQLLIEKGAGYLLDDPRAHDHAIRSFDSARHADYMANVRRKAEQAAKIRTGLKEENKKVALSKQKKEKNRSGVDSASKDPTRQSLEPTRTFESEVTDTLFGTNDLSEKASTETAASISNTESPTIFSDDAEPSSRQVRDEYEPSRVSVPTSDLPLITPTSSALLLSPPSSTSPKASVNTSSSNNIVDSSTTVPNLPPSYPLYRHLNSKNYYMTPGLRFGCQYSVYPGDPLRYHSHFLAVGYEWDEEIELTDIIGGGRLGTGVKKGWLIGGEEAGEDRAAQSTTTTTTSPRKGFVHRDRAQSDKDNTEAETENETKEKEKDKEARRKVRTFTVEWAAM